MIDKEKVLQEAIDRSDRTRKNNLDYAINAVADWDNGFIEGFKQGVEYAHNAHKEDRDMLEEAFVDNYVVDDGRIELEGMPLPCLNPIILLPYPQFEPGDKVRILVLKAEEKDIK